MFSVAIDGPAGAGKSSVARAAAKELGFLYIDTGAMYRAVALYFLRQGIDPASQKEVEAALSGVKLGIKLAEEGQKMFLGEEEVTDLIRTPEVSAAVPAVSAIPVVRNFLVGRQRELAGTNNVLMDGRDIGTVVLPGAQLKVFLTAAPEERARRRVRQLEEAGQRVNYQQTLEEILRRDYQDSHRETAPLKPAEGSVMLDTTGEPFEQSVARLVAMVRERLP